MRALLGNRSGKVKPWYLPFDWIFCRSYSMKVFIARNDSVANVYGLMVEIQNGRVVRPLNETDFLHTCGNCGSELQIVRPGKYQCPNCE